MTGFQGHPDRVHDVRLWRAVAATLRDVVAPALPPGYELDTVVQLQGLADYAATRPPDDAAERAGRLADALMAAPDLCLEDALRLASEALTTALDRPEDRRALERARAVRAELVAQLDRDVVMAAPLLETFAGHPASDEAPVDRRVQGEELARLVRWFEDALGGPVAVGRAVVLSGGHSRRMLVLDLQGPHGPERLVVRIEQGGTFGTDGTLEARVMQVLAEAGVPVAPVRWVEPDPRPLGQPFFVMDLVPGASNVDPGILESFLQVLHETHLIDPALLVDVLGPVPDPQEAVAAQIDRWTAVYRQSSAAPVPLLDEAAAWLGRHLHPTGPVALVHGDPGPGNFLHAGGSITAVTDWEFVHYGDAAEDWAYFATIRSRKLKSAAEWYAQIERSVGVRNDARTWHAWETFNQFKGACANLTALRLFREGTASTPNLLAIGTAVHFRFLRRLADLVGGSQH
jgi:aminoglycoside phosphotransferase (APT) family kinase protein